LKNSLFLVVFKNVFQNDAFSSAHPHKTPSRMGLKKEAANSFLETVVAESLRLVVLSADSILKLVWVRY